MKTRKFTVLLVISLTLFLAATPCALASVWIGDQRWLETAGVLMIPAAVLGVIGGTGLAWVADQGR